MKLEKVDANTIRVTVENVNEIPLQKIVENKEQLLKQKEELKRNYEVQTKQVDQTLEKIENVLKEAKKLGITAKKAEKKDEVKKNKA